MINIQFTCSLPFPWCKKCTAFEPVVKRMFEEDQVLESSYYCSNESLCIVANNARVENELEEKESCLNCEYLKQRIVDSFPIAYCPILKGNLSDWGTCAHYQRKHEQV